MAASIPQRRGAFAIITQEGERFTELAATFTHDTGVLGCPGSAPRTWHTYCVREERGGQWSARLVLN